MQKFYKIESGFLLAQKKFSGQVQKKKSIKSSEFSLAESMHHKPPTPDRPVRKRPSKNHFLQSDASTDPFPIWAEPEAWTCEEKRTAGSAGTKSLHAKWSAEKRP